MTQDKDIALVIKRLADSFPNFNLTKNTMVEYINRLRDVPVDALNLALERCQLKCKFFPTISELRDEVFEATYLPPPTAARAWSEFTQQASSIYPAFSHPLIAETINRLGGVRHLERIWTNDSEIGLRLDLTREYDDLVRRAKDDARMSADYKALRGQVQQELPPPATRRAADRQGEIVAGVVKRLTEGKNGR